MSLQLEFQYLQRNFPGVRTLVGPIELELRETFFPALIGGEGFDADFHKFLGHIRKSGSLVIPYPWSSEESAYNTSNVASGEMVGSLTGVTALNYVGYRAFVRGDSGG